jgi:acetyl-CoA synthetase
MSVELPAGLSNQSVVWRPRQEEIERSRMLAFAREHDLDGYDALCARAAAQPGWFWDAISKELGLVWRKPYTQVLDVSDGIAWPRWFTGGRMNYVTSAVDRHLDARGGEIALRWEGDDGEARPLTYLELAAEVNRCANALQALGVAPGDRVGIYLPMLVETAVAMLACGKLGAVIVPIFSGFGAEAVAGRINDAEVTLLITADGFYRRGRAIYMKPRADQALELAPTVQQVLVVRRTGDDIDWQGGRDHWWHELMDVTEPEFTAHDTAADTPFMIIYTSGTTGRPKGAVHVHSGFPVKAAQDLAFCFDLQPGDTLCWVTDLGWMMGPWAIAGGLIAGGAVLLYEGTPDYPQPDRLWQLVERHDVNVLGISPTAIRALMTQGDEWVDSHPMPTLRAIGSTGEPWNPAPWMWTLDKVGRRRCPIVNYSGGTEIGGGIVSSTTIHPLKPCSFIGPVPGVPADVVDAQGHSVRGAVGELVIRGPWVGMTNGFWKDPERYFETYWAKLPGLWVHGDWSLVDDDGFWFVLGRSDDTMNIAGKRVGPAEIESAAVAHPSVQEAAAIGVPHPVKGECAVIFAILAPGSAAVDGLEAEVLDIVAEQLGRPLRPERVIFVQDLPKTRNAKIMRRVIRARYLGQTDLGDLSALENPEAVEEITPAE